MPIAFALFVENIHCQQIDEILLIKLELHISTTSVAKLVTKTKNGHLIFAAILATLIYSGGLLVSKKRCLLQFP